MPQTEPIKADRFFTKTRLFKYIEILPLKTENFQIKKKLWYFFFIFLLKTYIVGTIIYVFEQNNKKNNVYPCKPQFY